MNAIRQSWFALLLALATGSAASAWTKTSESEAGTGYIDLATIRRSGDIVSFWEMTDYRIVPDKEVPYQSVKRHYEHDCKHMVFRAVSFTTYSGAMARGQIVTAIAEPIPWNPVKLGSVADIHSRIVCAKRAAR